MQFTAKFLNQPVFSLSGEVIPQRDEFARVKMNGKDPTPLTIRETIRTAITATLERVPEDDSQRYRNYALAKKIMAVKGRESVDLSFEELALIKKKLAYAWGQEIAGYVADVLEKK